MALLLQEAEKLSLDDLRMGIIEEIITEDPMFQYMNFIQANAGKTHTYIRESKEEVGSNFRLPGQAITEGASGVDPITLVIKAIIDDTNVDSFIQDTMSDHFDQTAVQISLRAKSVARRFRNALVNGGKTSAALAAAGSGNPSIVVGANPTAPWISGALTGSANIHGGTGILRTTVVADAAAATILNNTFAAPLYRGPSGALTTTVAGGTLVYPAISALDSIVQFKAPGDNYFGRPIVVGSAANTVFVVPSGTASKTISFSSALDLSATSIVDSHIIIEFTEQSEFAGIANLVDADQIINATGGASAGLAAPPTAGGADAATEYLAWSDLDQLHDKLRGYGAPMHVAGLSQVRAYKRLLRLAGGTSSAMLQMENFSRPVLTLEDAPVFKNDFVSDSGGTSSWYGIRTGDQGLTGVYAGNTAGVAVEDLGPRETVNARGYRVKLYGALALYSTQALVQITNLSNVGG